MGKHVTLPRITSHRNLIANTNLFVPRSDLMKSIECSTSSVCLERQSEQYTASNRTAKLTPICNGGFVWICTVRSISGVLTVEEKHTSINLVTSAFRRFFLDYFLLISYWPSPQPYPFLNCIKRLRYTKGPRDSLKSWYQWLHYTITNIGGGPPLVPVLSRAQQWPIDP